MAAYVDQGYYGWSHEDNPCQEDPQEVSASQMLDHGSISFGRYSYESLSWEKRSVFTFNKCQEELEKFKSPGLVAKKKAYFEEYYKKIRAMKALQDSQQTEITLDYSGDGSISSQTGEEDEATVENGGALADDATVQSEAQIEVSREVGDACNEANEVQIGHSDAEYILPDVDSSRNSFEEHDQEDQTICQTQQLDKDGSAQEPLLMQNEEPNWHELHDLDDKGVSKENSTSVTIIEPEVASRETSCPENCVMGDVELKPVHNVAPRKVVPAVRKCKDSTSVSKVKEPPSPARNSLKSEERSKPNTQKQKTSVGSKYPIQKTIVKSSTGVCSPSKATSDKVSRNYNSTAMVSPGPLAEVHSNVTIPRPFSLSTDRRAAVPSASREYAVKLMPKMNDNSSSTVKGRDALKVQGSSKPIATTSSKKSIGLENKSDHEEKKKTESSDNPSTNLISRSANVINSITKSRRLENKRGHEEKKKPVILNNQSVSLKARDTNMVGPVKPRSVNYPPRSKFSSNKSTDVRFNDSFRDNRHKEGRNEPGVMDSHKADTKVLPRPQSAKLRSESKAMTPPPTAKLRSDTKALTPQAGILRTEIKKIAPSWTSTVRRRFGELSLDGKKPRLEKPRWR